MMKGFIDMIKSKRLILLSLTGLLTFASPALTANAAWKSTSAGKMYTQTASPGYVTGWKKIGKYTYYFNSNGIMQKSKWIDGKYVKSNGVMATKMTTISGKTYYLHPTKGTKITGLVKTGGKLYYFNKSGVLEKNKWVLSNKYYASSTGALLTGLQEINGKLYCFNKKTCKKLTSTLVKSGGYYYYFKKDGTAAKKQWVVRKSKYYYFQSNWKMATNTWVGNYYVGADGARTGKTKLTGWQTSGGKKYYYDSDGNMTKGWKTISGFKYYFNSSGVMVTGAKTISGKKYYFNSDGTLAVSTMVIDDTVQYTTNASGVITKETDLKVSTNTVGGKIVNYALKYVGNPYVYGGTSLTKGADCSGFVQTVFAHFGIKVPRVADDQMKAKDYSTTYKAATVTVSTDSLMPGDLLFYGSGNYASHVAIYIGNGQIVHASNSQPYPAGGIKISNYNYMKPIRAMRYWS